MSMSIYAGKTENDPIHGEIMGPVIDFRCWDPEVLADDADERAERGESAFLPNPDYIPNAGMNLSNANARILFSQLGFEVCSSEGARLPIDAVLEAAMRGRNGAAARYTELNELSVGAGGATMINCGIPEGYMEQRIGQLLTMIAEGRKLGATHIVVC